MNFPRRRRDGCCSCQRNPPAGVGLLDRVHWEVAEHAEERRLCHCTVARSRARLDAGEQTRLGVEVALGELAERRHRRLGAVPRREHPARRRATDRLDEPLELVRGVGVKERLLRLLPVLGPHHSVRDVAGAWRHAFLHARANHAEHHQGLPEAYANGPLTLPTLHPPIPPNYGRLKRVFLAILR